MFAVKRNAKAMNEAVPVDMRHLPLSECNAAR
jgi:hypothetical protein